MQRKFTRKPKQPSAAPSPIIAFRDYSRATTPLDRYRKHFLMFQYWNSELIEALQASPRSAKRLKRVSAEALGELEALSQFLMPEDAERLAPLREHRAQITEALQGGAPSDAQAQALARELERETRELERTYSWRDLEGRLVEPSQEAPPAEAGEKDASGGANEAASSGS